MDSEQIFELRCLIESVLNQIALSEQFTNFLIDESKIKIKLIDFFFNLIRSWSSFDDILLT
ncbi:hypothetical protein BpHYR1_023499 [Brachionus plicatilis]|uniref:Uncharacterized protein n=1 Tax=Brachionus plicatilis TaxID=10195 RepID=A0A3M7SER3_BRAPC|nr:hypothetical protein BpHYR1_023499 [Brachionus plicatilis]